MASKFKQGGKPLDELSDVLLWKSDTFTDTVKFTPTPHYDEPTDIDYVKYNSGVLNNKWGDICVETDYNIKDDNGKYVPLPLAAKDSCPILKWYDGKAATPSDKLQSFCRTNKFPNSSSPLYIRAVASEYDATLCDLQVSLGDRYSWDTIKGSHAGFWFTLVGAGGGGAYFSYRTIINTFVAGGGGGGGGGTVIGYINLKDFKYTDANQQMLKITTGTGGSAGTKGSSNSSPNDATDGGGSAIKWIKISSGTETELGYISAHGGKAGMDGHSLSPRYAEVNGAKQYYTPAGGYGGYGTVNPPNNSGFVEGVLFYGGDGGRGTVDFKVYDADALFSSYDATYRKGRATEKCYIYDWDSEPNSKAGYSVGDTSTAYAFDLFANPRLAWSTKDNYSIGRGGNSKTTYTSNSNWQANGGGGGGCLMGGFNGSTPCGYGYGGHGASTKSDSPGTAGNGGDGCFMMYV